MLGLGLRVQEGCLPLKLLESQNHYEAAVMWDVGAKTKELLRPVGNKA